MGCNWQDQGDRHMVNPKVDLQLLEQVLAGGNPDAVDAQSRNALMLALLYSNPGTVQELVRPSLIAGSRVKRKADLFHEDTEGRTALFYAAERGDEQIIWLLLETLAGTGLANQRGALLNVEDKDGRRAEDWAERHGHHEIRAILNKERLRIDYFE